MAVSDDKKPVLSPALAQFLRRRVMEMLGLALVIAGIALCVALASAGTHDPSFNRVSNAPVLNLLGSAGANIASLLYGGAGLAAFLLADTPLFWGARNNNCKNMYISGVLRRITFYFNGMVESPIR